MKVNDTKQSQAECTVAQTETPGSHGDHQYISNNYLDIHMNLSQSAPNINNQYIFLLHNNCNAGLDFINKQITPQINSPSKCTLLLVSATHDECCA